MTRSDDTAWMAQGACVGQDPNLWHPVGRNDPNEPIGKAICTGCPVQQACLNWALATKQSEGIWGGHTTPERRHIDSGGLKQCADCLRHLPVHKFPEAGAGGNLGVRCHACRNQRNRKPTGTCGRPNCDQPLPSRRNIYCSPACAQAGNRHNQRARRRATTNA